ncbi:MAG: EAL domain-containing protein [Burkholderiales bacterium]|nr:EAL domain-containing protein [Burkholderiales bacterium]MDE1926113.1 EAL domain-containing protein [Burkholderiales bacterium]MDE2158286.1 EAL domain-containing protein [Burkholderiales bacterium]MDE2501682.1 EAL domain-containing protein [Burkholderiales bacterium]
MRIGGPIRLPRRLERNFHARHADAGGLDDFGAGCSSLGQLSCFAVEHLKRDRGFARDPPERSDWRAIVRGMTTKARGLNGLTKVAGVDAAEPFQALRAMKPGLNGTGLAAMLTRHGEAVCILQLQGFPFFAIAGRLLLRAQRERAIEPAPRFDGVRSASVHPAPWKMRSSPSDGARNEPLGLLRPARRQPARARVGAGCATIKA